MGGHKSRGEIITCCFLKDLKGFQAAHPCQSITVGGAQYRYVLAGNEGAQTLVLLNGGMNTLAMWTN